MLSDFQIMMRSLRSLRGSFKIMPLPMVNGVRHIKIIFKTKRKGFIFEEAFFGLQDELEGDFHKTILFYYEQFKIKANYSSWPFSDPNK